MLEVVRFGSWGVYKYTCYCFDCATCCLQRILWEIQFSSVVDMQVSRSILVSH